MAQTGFTPIQLYSSSTTGNTPAAADLLNSSGGSELAINIFDGKLFYKDSSGNVQVIGWKVVPVSAGGTGQTSYTDGQLLIGNSTGNTLAKSTLTAGSGIAITNGAGAITISATGGTGDVVGPASATDNAIARFDTTTGKLIQNSVVTISDTGAIAGATTITDLDYLDFDTTYATTLGAGQLGWNGNDTLGLGMIGGNVVQHIGEDTFFYVKASATITKGQLCMFTGAVGSSGVLTAAPSTAIPYAEAIIGVAAENIANNAFGLIQSVGTLRGVDTSAFLDGDILYYNSAVTGGFTKTFPTSGPIVVAAAVGKAGSGGSGVLIVRVSFQTRVTASTGISVTQGNDVVTVTNTAPDQVVSLTGAGTTSISGTYPSFTITSNDAYVGTVTSVAALTLGTTGTDLSSTVANGTTTPVITLQVPTASATNRGALSAADWSTFNGKAPGVTFTTGYVPFGQGTTTLNQSANLFWNNTSGNLGIGTTNPTAKLYIVSAPNTGGLVITDLTTSDFSITCGASSGVVNVGSPSAAMAFTTVNTERMRIFNSGGVSIGNTTDPGATNLSVTGQVITGGNVGAGVTPSAWLSTTKAIQLQGGSLYASNTGNIILAQNFYTNTSGTNIYTTTSQASYYQQINGVHYWGYAPSGTAGTAVTLTTGMALDNDGNFYVGTTSNGITGWNVSKSIILSSDYSTKGAFSVNSTNSTGVQYFMGFGVGSTVRGSISATTLGTTYATTSDYRLKENIAPLTNALAAVQALKPVTYTWKETKENSQGFIAHELAEVCPQAVAGEKDAVDNDGNPKYQGIDTSFLVVTLTAAIQEQQTLITNLTTRLEALEKGTL